MADADYIIIGSGAGGGPLAANLAQHGFKVLLLEAGGDLMETDDTGRLLYSAPVFHGLCSEDERCSWNYFVHHYSDPQREQRDSKYDCAGQGVWYPRVGALGGCTVHNAMITVTPQAIDWDTIAHQTGDWSWGADNMYRYFTRLEDCRYRSRPWTLGYLANRLITSALGLVTGSKTWMMWSSGHGFKGWLSTERPRPTLVLSDWRIVGILINTLWICIKLGVVWFRSLRAFDVNDIRNSEDGPEGVVLTTLSTRAGKRQGPREYLIRTLREKPDNLTILLHTLATRIIFEGKRAVGVEALSGGPDAALYEASPKYQGRCGTAKEYRARREVIVCAGAFNSPQLLMLSGIGPAKELARLNIPVVVDLPGVGANLQDRYEIAVVSESDKPFALLPPEATFTPPVGNAAPDPFLQLWAQGKGLYCSTGSLIALLRRSRPDLQEPDLFIFGLPGFFRGYFRGYSQIFERLRTRFTWIILKAYTSNTAGRVTLESTDPTKRPRVDFNYFDTGSDECQHDLSALVEGVEFVRNMNAKLGKRFANEIVPGPGHATQADLMDFIKNEAWGHHASCTNKIGPSTDPMAVLDSRFRVRGTEGLRVVDASVFPKIPGHFIVAAVYMISEKAFDVIVEDAGRTVLTCAGSTVAAAESAAATVTTSATATAAAAAAQPVQAAVADEGHP
ncbi:MAG: GMC family oxidoreductase N-terminal domain-containing protein [Xanthobacteraceae bacterium]|nr:GMC family oxidoreductase N-terminal domain-containing protein [Xanthobacteraceae bacterium]